MDGEALDNNVMLSIPLEVVTEILSRLPFKPLQRFKCVCKAWLHLLTKDSYFAKLHCKRVMVGMARKYDHDLDMFGPRRNFSWYIFFIKKEEIPIPADDQPLLDEVYQCFYGNCMTYSFQNFVRILNASGFPQRPCYTQPFVSFCNGSYVLEHARYRGGYLESNWCYPFAVFAPSAIYIAPTRKTCQRLKRSMQDRSFRGTKIHIFADENILPKVKFLSNHDVIIGTPPCVFYMLQRHSFGLDFIRKFVLYEADELFSRGHKPEIYGIFKLLPKNVDVRVITGTITAEAIEIPRVFWNKSKKEWRRDIPVSNALDDLRKSQWIVEKPRTNALDELKKSLRVERVKRVKCDSELASMIACGKVKNKERRKRRSTISWNPHLKKHM
ncbi:hypothetical protein ACHQM5_029709 [Ranunculus cassubicifolius]